MDIPLSDDELADLAEQGLDLDFVLGVVHAVVVAPGMIAPSQWLPLAFADVPAEPTAIGRVLRLYNEVARLLRAGQAFVFEDDNEAGCVAFAAGFTAGAALDPRWLGDAARWAAFAAPLAYLGDRRDLVPPALLADYDADPKRRQVGRYELDRLVAAAYEGFAGDRVATAPAARPRATSPRVGRNELCPCGSGKKYKRCCIDRPA